MHNVLNIKNERLLEILVILVQLQKRKQIRLTNHLVAIHVEHLECEFLDHVELLLVSVDVAWTEQHGLDSLIENVVVDLAVGPVEKRGEFLGETARVTFLEIGEQVLLLHLDVFKLLTLAFIFLVLFFALFS